MKHPTSQNSKNFQKFCVIYDNFICNSPNKKKKLLHPIQTLNWKLTEKSKFQKIPAI